MYGWPTFGSDEDEQQQKIDKLKKELEEIKAQHTAKANGSHPPGMRFPFPAPLAVPGMAGLNAWVPSNPTPKLGDDTKFDYDTPYGTASFISWANGQFEAITYRDAGSMGEPILPPCDPSYQYIISVVRPTIFDPARKITVTGRIDIKFTVDKEAKTDWGASPFSPIQTKEKHDCYCEFNELLRFGCKCGGK